MSASNPSLHNDSHSWAASRREGAGTIVSTEERLALIEAELRLPSVSCSTGLTAAKLVNAHHRSQRQQGSPQLLSLTCPPAPTALLSSSSTGSPLSSTDLVQSPQQSHTLEDPAATQRTVKSCFSKTEAVSQGKVLYSLPSRLPGVSMGMGKTSEMCNYMKAQSKPFALRQTVARHAFLNLVSSASQGVYATVREGMSPDGLSLSLRDCTLTDADMHAVACALHACHSIQSVDISDNPVSDFGAGLLYEAMRSVRTVTFVDTANTLVSGGMVAKLQQLAQASLVFQEERRSAVHERRVSRGRKICAVYIEQEMRALYRQYLRRYEDVCEEECLSYRRLFFCAAAGAKKARRRQHRRETRTMHAKQRDQLFHEQEQERLDLYEEHRIATLELFSRKEHGARTATLLHLLAVFKATKRAEKADWTLTRRQEKKRLARYGRMLQAQEDLEQTHRRRILDEEHKEKHMMSSLSCEQVTQALEVYMKRREVEEEEVRRKETEERRLEYEIISKREKELIEERRIDKRRRAEQQEILTFELQSRNEYEADEQAARQTYTEISENNMSVVTAREELSTAEQAYLRHWSRPPSLSLTAHRTSSKTIYECHSQPPSALNLEAELVHTLLTEHTDDVLAGLLETVNTTRDALREALSAASAVVRHNGVSWNEALTYGARPQGKPTPQPYSGVAYSSMSDPSLEEPLWMKEAPQRLVIRGGDVIIDVPKRRLSASTNHAQSFNASGPGELMFCKVHGTDEFFPPFGTLASYPHNVREKRDLEGGPAVDLSKMVITLPEDSTLSSVAHLLNCVQYKFKGDSNVVGMRCLRIRVGLQYPALHEINDPKRDEPLLSLFSSTERVETEYHFLTVISPVLIPAPLTKVAWYEKKEEEKHPDERGVAFLMDSNLIAPASIIRTPDPSIVEGSVKGFKVHIAVENGGPEDQLVMRTGAFADDPESYTKHDLEIVPCPSAGEDDFFVVCDGCPVAKSTVITPVREAVDRGVCAPNTAERGVTFNFNEYAKFSHFQKILRRLRFLICTDNVAANQETRTIEINVEDMTDNEFVTTVPLEIIPSEKPSTLDLKATKVYFRSLSTPSLVLSLRKYCNPSHVYTFPEAEVFDVDSDYVTGGGLSVRIQSGMCLGDYLFVAPYNNENISVEGSLVFYKMQCFGMLETGLTNTVDLDYTAEDMRGYHSVRYQPPVRALDGSLRESVTDIHLSSPDQNGDVILYSPRANVSYRHSRKLSRNGSKEWSSSGSSSEEEKPNHFEPRKASRISSVCTSESDCGLRPRSPGRGHAIPSLQNPENADCEIRLKLISTGSASLKAVSAFLRSIQFSNNIFCPHDGSRALECELHIGPTCKEQDFSDIDLKAEARALINHPFVPAGDVQTLTSKFEIKLTPPLFELHESDSVLEYREGSGFVKLAPFGIPQDADLPKDCFDGNSYLRVEILEGGCDDDQLSIKSGTKDKDEFKLKDKKGDKQLVEMPEIGSAILDHHGLKSNNVEKTVASMFAGMKNKRGGSTTPALSDNRAASFRKDLTTNNNASFRKDLTTTRNASFRKDLEKKGSRIAMKSNEEDKGLSLKDKMKKVTPASVLEKQREDKIDKFNEKYQLSSEIFKDGKMLGTVVAGKRQLLIRLASNATRKEVLLLLRSVVYKNKSQAPTELKKVVRVTLRDNSLTASQVVMRIQISEVDDVTQIVLQQNKAKYRPGQALVQKLDAFLITEYGRDSFDDPDTLFFDGGAFAVEVVAGGVKGDTISFLTFDQQNAMRNSHNLSSDVPVYNGPSLRYADGQIFLPKENAESDSELLIGTVEVSRSQFPGVNNFKICFAVHDPPIVSILLASYCMNCTTFACIGERLTSGHRALMLKVTDASNPEEGRSKTVINVCKPLLSLPIGSGVAGGGPAVKLPFVYEKGFTPGVMVNLLERITVNTVEGRALSVMTAGFTRILIEPCYEGDELVLPASLVVKDGYLKMNNESVGLVTTACDEFKIEHTNLSAKNLTYLLQQFQVKLSAESEENRVVKIFCADEFDVDPSLISITFNVSAPQGIFVQAANAKKEATFEAPRSPRGRTKR